MTFRVVVGYLPNVDYASEDAWRHGLVHRCAFVMNTDSPYSDDMVFNAPLYQALVTTVWEIVDSERADVRSLDQKVTPAARLAELETRLAEHSRVEDEPASEIIMFRGETAVAFIESQPWARFGGPNIYHDTYTVAVHTASDVSDLLVARAHELSTRCETELLGVTRLSMQPVRESRVRRLRRWLSGR